MAVKRTVDTLCPNSKGSCKPTWEWPFGRNHFRLRGCLSKPTSDLSLHSSLTAELDYVWGARRQERGWEPSGPPCLQAPLGLGNMEESCFQHQRPIIKASIKSGKYFTPSILGRKEHNLYWVYWGERDVISLCKYTEVKSLDHMVVMLSIFWRASTMFSIVTTPLSIPTKTAQGFLFLHILINT